MIKFSVLVSVYYKDSPLFLTQALESILSHEFLPDEIVLVEDGPLTPDLNAVLDIFCSGNNTVVKRVRLEENMGLGKALNEGMKHCSFDYVARMDSDDINLPDRFQKQISYLENHPEISVLGGYIEEFNETPGDLGRVKKVPLTPKEISRSIVRRNPLNHVSVMFKRKDIEACDSYDNVMFFEDYYLWFKLNKGGFKMANLGEVLLYVRIGNNMIGRRHGWQYMLKEYKFISKSLNNKLVTKKQALLMTFLRLPIRLMPQIVIKGVYRFFLR